MYSEYKIFKHRPDLKTIAKLVSYGSKVLDLGCGDGSLLDFLKKHKKVTGSGIELIQQQIIECVKRGVSVIHGNLNDGLTEIKDKAFDYIILSQTLQSVERPDKLLKEMTRVGKQVLVSFINMGYYKARVQLMFLGRMPVTKTLPYQWYDTPNIHLGTIKDFRKLCRKNNIRVVKEIPTNETLICIAKLWPNLFSATSVFLLENKI